MAHRLRGFEHTPAFAFWLQGFCGDLLRVIDASPALAISDADRAWIMQWAAYAPLLCATDLQTLYETVLVHYVRAWRDPAWERVERSTTDWVFPESQRVPRR